MKCKRHPNELGPGVCPSCLRDRLVDVLAAQKAVPATPGRRPDPILLPASTSPRRRSGDYAAARHHFLFFSTPQVTPSSAVACGHRSRSFLSSFFPRSRPEEFGADPCKPKRFGSFSWLSALIPRRRRRKKTKDPIPPQGPARMACMDRGMSPAVEEVGDTTSESGYSSEASAASRRAMQTPARGQQQHHRHGGGIAGFRMCLSPLVRPETSGKRWHVATATAAADVGFSGELRQGFGTRGGDTFGPNRSRKLADFGRFR